MKVLATLPLFLLAACGSQQSSSTASAGAPQTDAAKIAAASHKTFVCQELHLDPSALWEGFLPKTVALNGSQATVTLTDNHKLHGTVAVTMHQPMTRLAGFTHIVVNAYTAAEVPTSTLVNLTYDNEAGAFGFADVTSRNGVTQEFFLNCKALKGTVP